MEQMLEQTVVEMRGIHEMGEVDNEKMKAHQGRTEVKMDAYLEKMDSSLEDIKACRETMEALQ
jgi:hypothetical protein